MLSLSEIEIHGFKSFAERTKLPLPGDVIAVVGPNGSGKSNVADAVLWALGEQSAKSLRGQKMQDVIFQGSHRRPAAGMAEVYLDFREEGGARVRVGRRLLRTGESAYLIDGRPVRLKDIHEYLQRNGVSTQGTFLVEQGRVEGLLAASAEERRMILEEVAGIAHYKENRKSALQKLDATQGNLVRLQDILSEVETQMASLKKQAAKADRFVKLSEEIRQRKRSFLGRSYRLVAGRRSSLARDLELLGQEVHRREAALGQAESVAEAAKAAVAHHETVLQDLVARIHRREVDRERLDGENKRRTDQILSGQGRLRQIQADRADLDRRIAEAERECARLAEERAALEAQRAAAEADETGAREALATARTSVEGAEKELKAVRDELFRQSHEAALAGANLQRNEADLAKQEERLRRLEREGKDRATQEREAQEAHEDRRAALLHAQGSRERAEAGLATAEEALASGLRRAEESRSVAAGAERAQAAAAARLEALVQQASALRSTADAYLQGAAPERLTPTLAKLVAGAPEALHPALASAYGPHLEAHDGASWEGLPALLTALSAERSGVAAFSLEGFSSRRPTPPKGAEDAPGFAGWLPESAGLGDSAERRLPAVALLEDADAARAFAERFAFPAVSRDGVFVDAVGMVRGGAGGTGGSALLDYERERKSREKDLRSAERATRAALETAQKTLLEASRLRESRDASARAAEAARVEERARAQETREAEQHAGRLAAARDLLAGEVAQARAELEELRGERARLEEALKRSTGSRAEAEVRMRAIEGTLADSRRALDAAHEGLTRCGAHLAEVAQKAESKAGEEERSAAGKRDLEATLQRQLREASDIEGRNAGLSAEVTSCDRDLQALLLSLEEERGLRSRSEEDMKALQEAAQSAEQEARAAREALTEVRSDASAMERDLSLADAEHRHLVERIAEMGAEDPEELARAAADEPPIADEEREELQKSLIRLEGRLQELGAVNMLAREEYREMEERHAFLQEQKKDLDGAIASLQETIRKINRTTRERFMEAFLSVQEHFAHLFREVFDGGEARLSLMDETNPLESGVEIFAQPPGKKLTHLSLLSGGEKAKVALALLFALFKFRPHPFFILDEADAPFDDANVNRFNRLLGQFRGQTQFLVISHNKRTMELADALYGVTMVEGGVSRVVSVRLEGAESEAGGAEAR